MWAISESFSQIGQKNEVAKDINGLNIFNCPYSTEAERRWEEKQENWGRKNVLNSRQLFDPAHLLESRKTIIRTQQLGHTVGGGGFGWGRGGNSLRGGGG